MQSTNTTTRGKITSTSSSTRNPHIRKVTSKDPAFISNVRINDSTISEPYIKHIRVAFY
jgi:hypothetical protein